MPPMTVSADGAQDTLVGKLVADRYRVEAKLGEGGMGSVYRARHVTLDKPVALKVLHAEFSRKEDFVRRFLLEAKAASRIRNQHVIDITDFGTTDEGYVFFSMEFLAGKDLHSLLRSTLSEGDLLPWERAKGIFLQVCDALSAAHEKGIIHRDLKPENIFLVDGTGQQDFVKLLDFGIAKVEQADGEDGDGERKLTKTGMLFGTPEYMAPEQARGEKPDHRVDVYAMGCLLFQFITGTVPFQGESFMAILTQHMIEEVPAISAELLQRSGAPMGILDVIEKALVKDRDQRYGSISELATAVANAGMAKTRLSMPAEQEGSPDSDPMHTEDGSGAVVAVLPASEGKASNAKYVYGAIAALALGVGVFVAIPSGEDSGANASPALEGATVEQGGQKDTAPENDPVKPELVKETKVAPDDGLKANDENEGTKPATDPTKEDLAKASDPDADSEVANSGSGSKNSKGKTQGKTANNRGPDKNGSKDTDPKDKGEASAAAKGLKPKTKRDPDTLKGKPDKGSKVQIGDVKPKNDFPTE